MHKCLTIYEILADIIKNADNRSKARCSLVCKSWSEVALDEVWEVIGNDDGEYLFRTLFKCKNIRKYGDSGGVEERRFLENLVKWAQDEPGAYQPDYDWNRFWFYTKRIKSFARYNSEHKSAGISWLNGCLMSKVIRACPLPVIFPQLRSLELYVDPDTDGSIVYLSHFFSASVTNVVLYFFPYNKWLANQRNILVDLSKRNILTFAREVVERSPNVQNLEVSACGYALHSHEAERSLVSLVSGLRHLTSLSISIDMVIPSILLAASQHTYLVSLKIIDKQPCRMQTVYEQILSQASVLPNFPENAFPSFHSLHYEGNGLIFAALVQLYPFLKKSTKLCVRPLRHRSFLSPPSDELVKSTGLKAGKPPYHIEPINGFTKLRELTIQTGYSTFVVGERLVELVGWRPELKSLDITRVIDHTRTTSGLLDPITTLSLVPNNLEYLRLGAHFGYLKEGTCVTLEEPPVAGTGKYLKGLKQIEIDIDFRVSTRAVYDAVQELLHNTLSEECVEMVAHRFRRWSLLE